MNKFFKCTIMKIIYFFTTMLSFGILVGYFNKYKILECLKDNINFSQMYGWSTIAFGITIIVLFIISILMTIITAGRSNNELNEDSEYKITFNIVDHIYTEILFTGMLYVTVYYAILIGFTNKYNNYIESKIFDANIIIIVISIVYMAVFLMLFIPVIKHLKNHSLLKNTLIYDICSGIENVYKKIIDGKTFRKRMNVNLIILFTLTFIPIIGWGLAIILAMKWKHDLACDIEDLMIASNKLKEGTYEIDVDEIDDKDLFEIGNNLKEIKDNIDEVVLEKVKDEKEKIEIILNASYDLKNPLESIIENLKLLEENISDEKLAKKYIDIIKHRAERLENLKNEIDVSSKNEKLDSIQVNLENVDVFPFLTKGLSEIEQEMKKSNMSIKLNIKKSKLLAIADKNLLWRAFENLIKDIFKHGKHNTNVYISIAEKDNVGIISLRNEINDELKEELNITSKEFKDKYLSDMSKKTSLVVAKNLLEKQGNMLEVRLQEGIFEAIIFLRLV